MTMNSVHRENGRRLHRNDVLLGMSNIMETFTTLSTASARAPLPSKCRTVEACPDLAASINAVC